MNVISEHTHLDDTIFPTSWLLRQEVDIHTSSSVIDPSIKSITSQVDQEALTLLRHAMTLGRVVIVTAATRNWVLQGAKSLMPRCHDLLSNSQVRLVSARDEFQWKNRDNPVMWKTEAFDRELLERDLDQVFCIGDSSCEHEALGHALTRRASSCTRLKIKSLKLMACPSPDSLLLQLQCVKTHLSDIFHLEENFAKALMIHHPQDQLSFEDMKEEEDLESEYDDDLDSCSIQHTH